MDFIFISIHFDVAECNIPSSETKIIFPPATPSSSFYATSPWWIGYDPEVSGSILKQYCIKGNMKIMKFRHLLVLW